MSNKVFTGGIIWDPREPLPPELEESQQHNGRSITTQELGMNDTGFSSIDSPIGVGARGSLQSHNVPALPTSGKPTATTNFFTRPKTISDTAVHEPDRSILPPLSIALNAHFIQDTAKIIATQQFWNDTGAPIVKALFTFPLPNGCTLTGFSCRVGRDNILRAAAKPKQNARHEFNEAILRGAATGLLEQDTPEIFTCSLGNIPPNTRLKSKITFITLLKRRFDDNRDITSLTIPTSIASRYGEAPLEIHGSTSTDVRKGLSVEISIIDADRITKVSSNTHEISVDRLLGSQVAQSFEDLAGENQSSMTYSSLVKLRDGSTSLHRDFVLDIEAGPHGGSEQPKAWLETHPTLENHRALMVTVPPQLFMRDIKNEGKGEIVFLVDRSGSMSDKIDNLKSALKFFIKGIPPGKMFNIWCFGSHYSSMWPKSSDYTERSVREALEYVETFQADMGGTELLRALEAVIRGTDTSCPCDIIILTDGEVWRLDETLNVVQRTRTYSEGNVRFFSLGIGSAVSHALVEGIAKSGGGYSEVIPMAMQAGEDRVVAMLKSALARHIGPLQIDTGSQADGLGVLRSPAEIQSLNPFQNNRIFMLFNETARTLPGRTITIKTSAENGSVLSTEVPVHSLEGKDSTLHCLSARAVLEDLERGRSKIHISPTRPIPGSHEEQRLVQAEAEEIACKFSIASKWTSFFLAEDKPGSMNNRFTIPMRTAPKSLNAALLPSGKSDCSLRLSAMSFQRQSEDAEMPSPRQSVSEIQGEMQKFQHGPMFPNGDSHKKPIMRENLRMNFGSDTSKRKYKRDAKYSSLRSLITSAREIKAPQYEYLTRALATASKGQKKIILCQFISANSELDNLSKRLLYMFACRLAFQDSLTLEFAKASTQGTASLVSAETHNEAANLSISESQDDNLNLPEMKDTVRMLLTYQKFDGSFVIHDDTIEVLLGPAAADVMVVAQNMQEMQEMPEEVARLLASTATILAVLDSKMQQCKELWHLMWDKGLAYMQRILPGGTEAVELQAEVVGWLKLWEKWCQELRSGKNLRPETAGSDPQPNSKRPWPFHEQSEQQEAS